jgi:hypothetical protein
MHSTWTLPQPHVFAVYRANFNTVDRMNKISLGRRSVVQAVGTRTWWKRVFAAILSMSAANAYMGFVRPWEGGQKLSRDEYMDALAGMLINNAYSVAETLPSPLADPTTPAAAAEETPVTPVFRRPCMYQTYAQGKRVCVECGTIAHWFCTCGEAVCPASSSRSSPTPCFA